eukprot:Gregarina_sp_Poly_1__10794@NODE_82_length_15568_cov_98_251403_g70_i0_p12_GENE_NODE_82_length_15568_cov_98_251403_g70_i0NODE_82_length_15568_cov_98_251403_g70_i0_p12_ORF_typecomplete_len121_score26_80_NODE_82_length_15568_cov_98_251403_g70_i059526314
MDSLSRMSLLTLRAGALESAKLIYDDFVGDSISLESRILRNVAEQVAMLGGSILGDGDDDDMSLRYSDNEDDFNDYEEEQDAFDCDDIDYYLTAAPAAEVGANGNFHTSSGACFQHPCFA